MRDGTKWSLRLSVHVLIPLTKCCPDAVYFSLVLREGGYKIYRLQLWLSSMMRWKCGKCLAHGISQDRWEGGVTLGWADLALGRLCTCQRESFRPKCGLHFFVFHKCSMPLTITKRTWTVLLISFCFVIWDSGIFFRETSYWVSQVTCPGEVPLFQNKSEKVL